jgi:hypothetical protein
MKIFLSCLLLLMISSAQSQNFSIQTIGMIKDKVALSDAVMFNNNVYAVQTEGKSKLGWTLTINKMRMGCTIFRYDSTMALLKENVLANGDDVYGPLQPFLKVLNDHLYLISYDYNTTDGIIINISEVDPNTLEVSVPKKVLNVSQKNIGIFKMMNLYSSYKFYIQSSPDKSRILFLWNPGVTNIFSYAVADSNMNFLRSATEVVENVTDLEINSLLVDNAGSFYAAYITNKKNKNLAAILAVDTSNIFKVNVIKLEKYDARSACIFAGLKDNQLEIMGPVRTSEIYVGAFFSMQMDKTSLAFSKTAVKEIP